MYVCTAKTLGDTVNQFHQDCGPEKLYLLRVDLKVINNMKLYDGAATFFTKDGEWWTTTYSNWAVLIHLHIIKKTYYKYGDYAVRLIAKPSTASQENTTCINKMTKRKWKALFNQYPECVRNIIRREYPRRQKHKMSPFLVRRIR